MFIIVKKRTVLFLVILFIVIAAIIFKITFIDRTAQTNAAAKSYIALVIDDLGNNGDGIDELIKLDIPITAAVMPYYPHSESDAKKMYDADIEMILHLPMEPEKGNPNWLAPRTIMSNYSNEDVRAIIENGLDEIKWAKGINNHMGSKIMKNETIMREILNIAKEKNLYFLNSKTDGSSVSKVLSKELDVIYFERDIFLDNEATEEYISRGMENLANVAMKKGYAIGIGHVGDQGGKITIEVIDKMSKKLKSQGIEFIYLSQMKEIIK